MDETKPDGGPAFPTSVATPFGDGRTSIGGMSLRDYFAAKVIGGLAAVPDEESCDPNKAIEPQLQEYARIMATAAYRWADAMLEARK